MNMCDLDEDGIEDFKDRLESYPAIADYFLNELSKLRAMSEEERMDARYKRLTSAGAFAE